jgi:hypothetical protein
MLFLTSNSKGEANILSLRFKPMTLTIAKMGKSLVCVRGKKQYNPQRDLIIVIHL